LINLNGFAFIAKRGRISHLKRRRYKRFGKGSQRKHETRPFHAQKRSP
jgi:hypothetical protein